MKIEEKDRQAARTFIQNDPFLKRQSAANFIVHGMNLEDFMAFSLIQQKKRHIRKSLLELGWTNRKGTDPKTGRPTRIWERPKKEDE